MNRSPEAAMIDIVQSAFQSASTIWGKDFARAIRPHAVRHSAMLIRLNEAHASGDKKTVRSAQHQLLNSHSSRVTSLVRAVSRTDNILASDVSDIASKISPYEDCGEMINVWMVPKALGNGSRPICGFGAKRKAQQHLVADILAAKFPRSPWDYLVRGRGTSKLAKDISSSLNGGQAWVLVADIKDFYRSVQRQQLDTLVDLPISVVENSVFIPSTASVSYVSMTTPPTVFDGAVLGGLPQGSGVSGLVASMLCGTWLEQVAQTCHVFLHGDDIMAIAGSELGARTLEKSLAEYLSAHPQGPFHLKRSEVVHAQSGFDFCGYRFRQDPFNHEIKIRPSNISYARLKLKIMKIARDHPTDVEHRVQMFLTHWVEAFTCWPRNDLSLEYLEAMAREAMWDVEDQGYTQAIAMHFKVQ